MDLYPRLADVTIQLKAGTQDTFEVQSPTLGGHAEIGSGPMLIATLFDGTRTFAEVFDAMAERGTPLPNPQLVEGLAQMLAQARLVELLDAPLEAPDADADAPPADAFRVNRPLKALGALRHACTGCGRSCEGQRIGPIDDPFIDRLPSIQDTLKPLYPDLAAHDDLTVVEMYRGNPVTRLKMQPSGACIFLGKDRLCRIHKHMGAEAKPFVCRFFPLHASLTEHAIRIDVALCFTHHTTYNDPEVGTLDDDVALLKVQPDFVGTTGSDPSRVTDLPVVAVPGSPAHANQRQEAFWVENLDPEAYILEDALAALIEVATQSTFDPDASLVQALQTPDIAATIADLFHRYGKGFADFHEHFNPDHALDPDTVPHDSFAQAAFALREQLLTYTPTDAWTGWTDAESHYSLYTLRRMIYLRDWLYYPAFGPTVTPNPMGLAAFALMGSYFASVLAATNPQAAATFGPVDTPMDAYNLVWTTWLRMLRGITRKPSLFATPREFVQLAERLYASVHPAANDADADA